MHVSPRDKDEPPPDDCDLYISSGGPGSPYDGDGKPDAAIFRPTEGNWYILRSTGGFDIVNWGLANDIAVHGDYDGDAKTDIAVYRPSEGIWYILRSADGFTYAQFGLPTDLPVQADYDGDGLADLSVYRPAESFWYSLKSSDLGVAGSDWGLPGDIPIANTYLDR